MHQISRYQGAWLTLIAALVAGAVLMVISGTGGRGRLPGTPLIGTATQAGKGVGGGGYIFGLDYADQLPEESYGDLVTRLNDAGAAGAGWVRVDLAWYRIQPSPDTWDWSSFDRTVAAAHADGLEVLAIVGQPPAWARQRGCADLEWCPPADDTQFAAFAAKAAQRYPSGEVGAWEVWNEENMAGFWPSRPDPAAYAKLLETTTTAVRAVAPKAFIVLGGLALTGDDGTNLAPQSFLRVVAADGALAGVSAIGYHPYTFPVMPQSSSAFTALGTGRDSLVGILESAGAHVPIWITESGAPVAAAGEAGATETAIAAQEREQAAYATALVQAATANPYIKAVFWFSDIDLPSQHLYYGLRRADGSARPSFTALKRAIEAYAGR
jgi:hypothetical protein